ncbi:MAG: hypothetical protein GY768_18965 [Planctomycetaceae bacterium]|nr:hypothetical protein [Planctomycetaceae bacterium]
MARSSSLFQKLKAAQLIRRSNLLHEAHYRSQFYQELKADRYLLRLSPVLHYVFFGANDNKNPNKLFDTEYYRTQMFGQAESERNPLEHFIAQGAKDRQNPGPFFDTRYYLENCPEAASSGINPLSHYFLHGRSLGLFPHPLIERIARPPQPCPVEQEQGRQWLQMALGAPIGNPSPSIERTPHRSDRLIRFEWDPGGWNNIRMQAEVLVCLARRYQRALVLPPADRWYLIPGNKTNLFDYFNEAAFRAAVPVLQAKNQSADVWKVPTRLAVISTGRLKRAEFDAQQHRECWYFPSTTRMFGTLAHVFGRDIQDYQLLHDAFRLRDDLLDKTSELLEQHGLQPGDYLAAHIRRGDFGQAKIRHLSTTQIIKSLRQHGADSASRVLIVSDAWDEDLLSACRTQGWKTVCWATSQSDDDKLAGVLDMLSCCLAWRFVGTRLSTFSNGIIQWRGYMSLHAGKHIDAEPKFSSELEQLPWWGEIDKHTWLSI